MSFNTDSNYKYQHQYLILCSFLNIDRNQKNKPARRIIFVGGLDEPSHHFGF